jgi:hypothetical protein
MSAGARVSVPVLTLMSVRVRACLCVRPCMCVRARACVCVRPCGVCARACVRAWTCRNFGLERALEFSGVRWGRHAAENG